MNRFNKYFVFIITQQIRAIGSKRKYSSIMCCVSFFPYNCESWGDANLEPLERKYRQALKSMLGVRKSTCNELPYIDLGNPTLKYEVHKRQLFLIQRFNWGLGASSKQKRSILKIFSRHKCMFRQYQGNL